ncbi:DUF421 domain-containing protein [Aeromicrobium phragmitis]|uniref:DUF421 domain-containing protein n=1 Tax=Aeromicrobium phragmitis TaxID=2478914 RepID=A0A3L8PNU9_9ACTN|nr:YetF domain-containing protein [Aeromicrobium phragmitis]RLV55672.1 DUF421 domain-containing protein [Aeromicrobium phragmitis]
MWFDSWSDIGRIVAVGIAAYVGLMLVLRGSGKRTLSQLNAFDFIVTVALGSTLATILLNSTVSWAEGVVALGLLTGLQLVVAWISSHWPKVRSLVTAAPTLLVRDGMIVPEALRRHRLTESEVHQAIRSSGSGSLSNMAAVVLETNGTISVITSTQLGDGSAMGSLLDGPSRARDRRRRPEGQRFSRRRAAP